MSIFSRTLLWLCISQAVYDATAATLADEGKRVIRKIAMSVSADGDVHSEGASLYEDMEVSTRVANLMEEVEEMARSGGSPEPEKITIIKNIVNNELIPDLKATRQSSVDQIGVNLAAINTCNKNGVDTQQKIASSTEVSVGSARSTHTACRTEEKNKKSTKEGRCKELDDFLNGIAVPQSMPKGKERGEMVPYVQKMSSYFCPKGPTVTKLDKACKTAEKEHAEHKASCDKNQAAFEMAFCQWRMQITDTCTTLDQCYNGALTLHNKFVADTKVLEKKWKIEYSSLKKIVCYTDVWLTDNKVSAGNLQKCHSTTVDTSPMDIAYPEIPAQAQCVTTKVDVYPGSSAFPTTEYKDFLDFAVSVIPCVGIGKQQTSSNSGGGNVNIEPTPEACEGFGHKQCPQLQSSKGWHSSTNMDLSGVKALCFPKYTKTSLSTCKQHCEAAGFVCLRAQDNVKDSCSLDSRHHRQTYAENGCLQKWHNQICQCGKKA
jgi:hypothetical protein